MGQRQKTVQSPRLLFTLMLVSTDLPSFSAGEGKLLLQCLEYTRPGFPHKYLKEGRTDNTLDSSPKAGVNERIDRLFTRLQHGD